MAGETKTTSIAGLVDDISAEVIFQLNATIGITDGVDWRDTKGKPGSTLDFPKYGSAASSDVSTVAEGTDHSTNKEITNTDVAAKVADKVIMATITDEAQDNQPRNKIIDDVVTIFTDAVNAKLEDDIVGLFGTLDNTVCGAGTTMTLQHWYDSIRQIRASGGKRLYACVSPKQYYGAKGLIPLLSNAGIPSGVLSAEFQLRGYVPNPFNIRTLVSNEIDEDVGSGGDAAGAVFSDKAIGLHSKGIFKVAFQRDESLRAFELVAVGRWKAVELLGGQGVYFLSDVA